MLPITIQMTKQLLYLPLFCLGLLSCQSGDNEEKTIASTHPKLEERLKVDSVRTPVDVDQEGDLYHRYRITMEEYETGGTYAVTNTFRGSPAPLDVTSHADARTHRTALAEGLQQGVNFAGRYTVVSIPCGDNCQTHYVVDRENGQVKDKVQSSAGARYSAESRLLIVNPADSTYNYSNCSTCEPKAYVLENGRLSEVNQAAN